jgi:hypothetical protein
VPAISIPEALRPTLERIASMSDPDVQTIREALSSLKPHLKPEAIVKSTAGKSEIADFAEIVQTLTSLSITRFRVDVPLEEFVHDVSRSLPLKKDLRAALDVNLKSLLSIDALVLSARAFDIQHEYEKVFRSARIVTDLRPVFSADGTAAIAAMIVHNFIVSYFGCVAEFMGRIAGEMPLPVEESESGTLPSGMPGSGASGTPSPNPWDLSLSRQNVGFWFYTEGT